jgi:hypothetical protein
VSCLALTDSPNAPCFVPIGPAQGN